MAETLGVHPETVKDRASRGQLASVIYNDKHQRLYAPPKPVSMIACTHCGKSIPDELPSTAVLPGEHVLDALCRCLAGLGLTVAQFTGYLGFRDTSDGARVFCFAVTATHPNAICRSARIGHEWVDLDDSDRFPSSAHSHLLELSARLPES